jgi:hypothetical protein
MHRKLCTAFTRRSACAAATYAGAYARKRFEKAQHLDTKGLATEGQLRNFLIVAIAIILHTTARLAVVRIVLAPVRLPISKLLPVVVRIRFVLVRIVVPVIVLLCRNVRSGSVFA